MDKLEKLVRPHILNLKPYSSARDDFSGSAEIYLDANENPFGSIPQGQLNRYPDPLQFRLKSKLGELKEADVSNIFIGNGSDEPIDLLIRAFCEPGIDKVVIMPPTYGMYKVSASINNVGIKSIPLTENFQIDTDALKNKFEKNDKLIFVCNPNNPTGNLVKTDVIFDLARSFDGLVVVDEAYIDFANQPSLIGHISEIPNLIVLQTFSKAWGLAATRLGVAYAHSYIIDVLTKIKPPYNINQGSQEIGYEALLHLKEMQAVVDKIIIERQKLADKLSRVSDVEKVFPSSSNFLLVKIKNHQRVNLYLQGNGVVIRDRSKEINCEQCLRITIGTPEENNRLLELLEKFV